MVESGAGPIGGGVADSTVLRESGRRVIGSRGFLEISEMAAHALLRSSGEDSVDVTLSARDGDVRPGEREPAQVVIERGVQPGSGSVTTLAAGGELAGLVVGIRGVIVVGQVAAHALLRRSGKDSVCVTLGTRDGGMRAGQRETGELRVVKAGAGPHVNVVTVLTGGGEFRRHVVQRCGAPIVLEVAADARSAQSGIDARGGSMVAVVADSPCVRAN